MKTNWKILAGRFLSLMVVVTVLAACDSSGGISGDEFVSGSLDETVAFLAVDLGLSASETAAFSDSFAKFGSDGGDRDPGFLWYVAADLQATLTDEQKAKLFDRIAQADARQRRGGGGQNGQGGFRPGGHGGGVLSQVDLTEDQEAAITAIRESYKLAIEAVLAQRDTLTREEIKEQLVAIRDQAQVEVEAVLTADQLQQIADLKAAAEAARAEREAQREANRAAADLVKIEVLGLTDQQIADLDALKASAEAERDAIRQLADSGASDEDIQAAIEAAHTARQDALAAIVDDTQLEIIMIHGALASRMQKRRAGRGGHGGRPGAGGGSFSG